ncbi:MAG: DUF2461 domain-containing protein [Bacteroidales bacterium]|nr:DUF2461 domain-containing protein [Bacteroidales bacterium]
MAFTGFTKSTIAFLKDLAVNNNKEWFEGNRSSYDEHLLTPLKGLSAALGPLISSIDVEIEIAPNINKTISKIYRDVRFSNDKSPFRTDQWLTFKRPGALWGNVPEFYFYFTPEEYHYGMGYYQATPERMNRLREHIVRHPDRFAKIIDAYENQDEFKLVGEAYKRSIPNEMPQAFQPWFQKKTIALSCTRKLDQAFYGKNLLQLLSEAFTLNAELYLFITESINYEAPED